MRVESFEWDDANTQHIARHQVDPDEAEELFEGWVHYQRSHTGRYLAFGQTVTGRYLVCVIERVMPPGCIRVVTARDMNHTERRLYKRKRPL